MRDLLEALLIFLKYDASDCIHCEHDALHVCISPNQVSGEDCVRLEQLSFTPDGNGGFFSFRFGSC